MNKYSHIFLGISLSLCTPVLATETTSLEFLWLSAENQNQGLLALQERQTGYAQSTKAALSNFAPSFKIEAQAQHLNSDLTMDLDPIRQALIQLQSADQVQFAQLSEALKGSTLSDAQKQAVLGSAQTTFSQKIPPFSTVVRLQDQWTAAAVVVQPLFMGGKIKNGYQLAQEQQKLGQAEFTKSKSDIHKEIARLYIQRLMLSQSILLRLESVALLQNYEKRAQALIEQGMMEPRILLQAQMNLEDSKSALAEDSTKVSALDYVLSDLSGQKNINPHENLPEPKIPNSPPQDWAQITESAQVQLAQSQTNMAQKMSQIKSGEIWPEVAAFGRYELHKEALTAFDPEWVVGIKATIPLKITDYYSKSAAKSKAREAQFALQMQKGQSQALSLRYGLLAQSSAKRYYSNALRDSLGQENHRLAKLKWEQGQNSEVDAMDAAVQWHKARLERLQMAADAWTNYLEWAGQSGQLKLWIKTWNEATHANK
jgi:outer membrane protein TolC